MMSFIHAQKEMKKGKKVEDKMEEKIVEEKKKEN